LASRGKSGRTDGPEGPKREKMKFLFLEREVPMGKNSGQVC